MAIYSDIELKQFFENNDIPTEQEFQNLIDSKVSVLDGASASIGGDVIGGVSGSVLFIDNLGKLAQDNSNLFYDNAQNFFSLGLNNPTARLNIKAQGALSTDNVLKVRNNLDTYNLFELNGDGGYSFKNNVGFNLFQQLNNGAFGLGLAINMANVGNADVLIGNTSDFTNPGQTGRVAVGSNTVIAENYGTAIGGAARALGAGSVALGYNAQGGVGGSQAGGAIGMSMRSGAAHSWVLGSNYSDYVVNDIPNSFMIHLNGSFGGRFQHFFVNRNTNVVLNTNIELTSGIHFDSSATNCQTIHNGIAPIANIANGFTQYSNDVVAGNAAPHFRTENGDVIKLYKASSGWSATNYTQTKTFDASNFTTQQLGNIVATLIEEVHKLNGFIS